MKSPLNRVTLLSLAVGAALGFATCKVDLGDDPKYVFTCAVDSDCGGDGYKCAVNATRGTCCLPSGKDDSCDKKDNDCDGLVDNTGKSEVCNGVDDDCNGSTDETFDLQADLNNCGTCKKVCGFQEPCIKGKCIERKEIDCSDGFDNDDNGKTDCDDSNCELRQCGAACLCKSLKKAEVLCNDGVDNDNDGLKDCADPDCLSQDCRVGCTCVADGGQSETGCTDGVDNDGDALVDCLDTDCIGRFCTPPLLYFSCTASLQCKCNGSVQISEVGSVFCRDGVDNDCDGVKDCGQASCDGQSCNADGGLGCECSNKTKKEKNCRNTIDDDADLLIDCADSDCLGVSCDADAGVCTPAKACQ